MHEVETERELRKELIGEISDETFHTSYLIEAGAGAGKTYILSNRIVNQLLHEQARPEELVAITFTEKATQEMINRIDKEISGRLVSEIKTNGDSSPEALKLRDLSDSIDQMQISTIHSFCRTLLMTMPFQSELGPEFEVTEDDLTLAARFIEMKIRENPEIFDELEKKTGISRAYVLSNFQAICESRAELQFEPLTDEAYDRIHSKMADQAHQIWNVLQERAEWTTAHEMEETKTKTVSDMLPQIHEVMRLKAGKEEAFSETTLNVCNPCLSASPITLDAITRVLKLTDASGKKTTLKANKASIQGHWNAIIDNWSIIIHACTMEVLAALISEYREFKKSLKVATQQDLLYCTRDLLRDSAEARQYFHQRYRCIYVDEMQDTDPVQAQILFYLTTEEEYFDPNDWRNCRPIPGSLFLVGDPKQAIYRFRGADIGVYKTLIELFHNGIGKVLTLHFNYRSSSEITDFSDAIFADRLTPGPYQADYSSMRAVNGNSERAVVRAYPSTKDSDPQRVAAFINQMVKSKVLLGINGNEHEVLYKDFMILTNRNGRTEDYVKALSEYGIPCSMSGAKRYSDVPQIQRLTLVLKYLADFGDDLKLASVLTNCYGISYPVLRAYRQRTGYLNAEHLSVKCALLQEGCADQFESLFAALDELSLLRTKAKSTSAVSLVDWIAKKSYAVWGGEKAGDYRKEYAMLLQFSKELREGDALTIPALAARAEELRDGAADRELLLDGDSNCVQILNLHKAKGLESEVIILACDSEFPVKAVKHAVFDGNRELLHYCISYKDKYNRDVILGAAETWGTEAGAEELQFLEKQIDRLLYVAATRAKTCLLIGHAAKSTWGSLVQSGQEVENRARDLDQDGFTRYHFILDPDDYENQEPSDWIEPFKALLEGNGKKRDDDGENTTVVIDPVAFEYKLIEKSSVVSQKMTASISPSMVEKGRRIPDELEENEAASSEESVSFVTVADLEGNAHGTIWGTAVHRLMEFCVKKNAFNSSKRKILAERAFRETLGNEELTADARKMLDPLDRYADLESLVNGLVEQAVELTAFMEDENHPLNVLLKDGKAFTELPFQFREETPDVPIRELCANLIQPGDKRCVEIHGIIDLAVKCGNAWTIIDYKTDAFLPGETQSQFAARLKEQYSPQIMLYREILQRMGMGKVEDMYLCSIAMQGAMISLSASAD